MGGNTKLHETRKFCKGTFRVFLGQRIKNLHAVKIARLLPENLIFINLFCFSEKFHYDPLKRRLFVLFMKQEGNNPFRETGLLPPKKHRETFNVLKVYKGMREVIELNRGSNKAAS